MATTGSIYRSEAARVAVERLYDEALARLPFATESRIVSTRFGDSHVLIAGPVDTILDSVAKGRRASALS